MRLKVVNCPVRLIVVSKFSDSKPFRYELVKISYSTHMFETVILNYIFKE